MCNLNLMEAPLVEEVSRCNIMTKKNFQESLTEEQASDIQWFLSKPELVLDYLYLSLKPEEEEKIDNLGKDFGQVSELLITLMNYQLNGELSRKEMQHYLFHKHKKWFIQQLIYISNLLEPDAQTFNFQEYFSLFDNP